MAQHSQLTAREQQRLEVMPAPKDRKVYRSLHDRAQSLVQRVQSLHRGMPGGWNTNDRGDTDLYNRLASRSLSNVTMKVKYRVSLGVDLSAGRVSNSFREGCGCFLINDRTKNRDGELEGCSSNRP